MGVDSLPGDNAPDSPLDRNETQPAIGPIGTGVETGPVTASGGGPSSDRLYRMGHWRPARSRHLGPVGRPKKSIPADELSTAFAAPRFPSRGRRRIIIRRDHPVQGLARNRRRDSDDPVSYTHLTLPTIYSV